MVSCVGDADAAAIGWEHASAAFHPVRNSTVQWHRVACSVATVQTDSSWQLLMHARARARRTRTQGTAQSTDSVLPLAPEPERPTAGASSFSLEFGRRGSTPRWFPLPFRRLHRVPCVVQLFAIEPIQVRLPGWATDATQPRWQMAASASALLRRAASPTAAQCGW